VTALEEHLLHAEALVCASLEASNDRSQGSTGREVPFLLPGAGRSSATAGSVGSSMASRIQDCR
jgi:hypothetical protein